MSLVKVCTHHVNLRVKYGSCRICMCSALRDTVEQFYSMAVQHFTPTSNAWVIWFPASSLTSAVFSLFHFSQSSLCTVVLHCGFKLQTPDYLKKLSPFLYVYCPFRYSFLGHVCLSFVHNSIWLSAFFLLSFRSCLYSWYELLYRYMLSPLHCLLF